MKPWLKITLFLVLPVGIFILVLGGFFKEKVEPGKTGPNSAKVSNVKVMRVEDTASDRGVTVPGTVVSDKEAKVSSKIMASVREILVSEGDRVKQGDPLILLDPSQVSAYTSQARAGIQEAEAARGRIEEAIKQAEAGVELARARFQNAEATYNRVKSLYQNGAASRQDYDNAETEYLTAKAQLEQTEAGLKVAQAQKGEILANYNKAVAAYEATAVNLNDATVRAPFDGVVTRKIVDQGDMASPGMPLIALEKGPYSLQVYVDERMAKSIKLGDEVKLHIDALDKDLTGRVTEITPRIDPASRTFNVKVMIPDGDNVKPGMFGKAVFSTGEVKATYIPQTAVVRWSQFTGVFVLDDQNRARLRYVSLGKEHDGQVEVLSGLTAGERIVAEGTDRVTDGSEVVSD